MKTQLIPEQCSLDLGDGESFKLDSIVDIRGVFADNCRQCPGRGMAEAQSWIVIASVLKIYNIELPLDEAGMPYTPPTNFKAGILR